MEARREATLEGRRKRKEKTAPLPPITTRWETVIPSMQFILEYKKMIMAYGAYKRRATVITSSASPRRK